MTRVPILYVEPSDRFVRYRLEITERDLGEPLLEEIRHPLDERTLRALRESADALLRGPESTGFTEEARTRGTVLYRTLVPPRLRERLKAITGPLLVSTSLYGLPWELLYDDEEFWGIRYAIGKRLVMDRPLPAGVSPSIRARPRALIVGADPRGDLPFVKQEVEAICDALEKFADICCVTDRMATFDAVTAYLGGSFDLIHYCGHVVPGGGEGPALLLAGEALLSGRVIEANVVGRPLVFLNGCASARGVEHERASEWETTSANIAYGFLFGGAVGVVATLCEVSDHHAARLAERFYHHVLAPMAVGEALRQARTECRADSAAAGSPTWLSFVLYGNPVQTLRAGDRETATVRPVALPVRPAAPRVNRVHSWVVLLALVVLGLASGLWYVRVAEVPSITKHDGPVVVGVMEVQARSASVPDWMREITRDSLNTILSKFDTILVYSRQKIDFLREKRQLSEIEAAETLGMTKMISATLALDGQRVTVELQVVDIRSGLLEGSETVHGSPHELMDLQNQLAIRALSVLGVSPTAERMAAIFRDRTNDTLESYRMLSETLGGALPGDSVPSSPPHPGTSWLPRQAIAYADEIGADEQRIRTLLAEYAAALSAKDLEALAALQGSMTSRQRDALVRYFGNAGDLAVRISDVDVLIEGDEALATFTREDEFVDARSGRQMRLEVRMSGTLMKGETGWQIVGFQDRL